MSEPTIEISGPEAEEAERELQARLRAEPADLIDALPEAKREAEESAKR